MKDIIIAIISLIAGFIGGWTLKAITSKNIQKNNVINGNNNVVQNIGGANAKEHSKK